MAYVAKRFITDYVNELSEKNRRAVSWTWADHIKLRRKRDILTEETGHFKRENGKLKNKQTQK